MLARIENGIVAEWPLAEHAIQAAHPNTSFAFPLNDETIEEFGFARFEYSDPPEYNAEFQQAKEVTPVLNGAVATQAWEIIEKYNAEEKAEYIAQRDAAAIQTRAASLRAYRNELLAACDWTQLPDAPVNQQAWANYRQQLRDISTQPGFPSTVEWPHDPNYVEPSPT